VYLLDKKDHLRALFVRADEYLQRFNRLDYAAIIAHKPEAVAVLQEVVRSIRGALPRDSEALDGYAQPPQGRAKGVPDDDKSSMVERRRSFVEALSHSGLGARLGKVYCTQAETRVTAFRDVPHKTGLPQFDMVVAADYSPQAGYHGIFVAAHEVMSWVLPSPYDRPWQLRERHGFASLEQMTELVGLLGAGFPVS
jgi:hypothetical protein